ncbi:MAG TPA: hypothetical protein VNY07_06225, partial [Chthoniobacterales bacterium]|nr:hypothetical protein [Chthoniobacterales bacterium]
LASELARPRTVVANCCEIASGAHQLLVAFVIVPLVLVLWLTGLKALAVWLILPLFLVLVAVGERGFRIWKRLWKIP